MNFSISEIHSPPPSLLKLHQKSRIGVVAWIGLIRWSWHSVLQASGKPQTNGLQLSRCTRGANKKSSRISVKATGMQNKKTKLSILSEIRGWFNKKLGLSCHSVKACIERRHHAHNAWIQLGLLPKCWRMWRETTNDFYHKYIVNISAHLQIGMLIFKMLHGILRPLTFSFMYGKAEAILFLKKSSPEDLFLLTL